MADSTKRIDRLDLVLQVFIDLENCYASTNSLEEYISSAHQLLSKLIYTPNFYLALYHRESNSIQFIYNVDEIDEPTDTLR